MVHTADVSSFTDRLVHVGELDTPSLQALQRQAAAAVGLPVVFRDRLDDGSEGPQLCVIPAGSFEMGSPPEEFGHRPEEGPVHYVALRRAFALGRFTITADEFAAFQRDSDHRFRSDLIVARGRHPVMNIRIADAKRYCAWLSERTGQVYRLPTEAEWEYACRAGTSTPFHFGDSVTCREVHFNATFPYIEAREKRRWFLPRCVPLPTALEVGSKPPNAWGLHEMHGNVWEFTQNPWTTSHLGAHRDGSAGSSRYRDWIVVKGGSWFDAAVLARSAARRPRLRDEMDVNLGFRVLRELS